ncbi:MAG: oligosaccharide flippase family protein [Terracidiphilus sp.]
MLKTLARNTFSNGAGIAGKVLINFLLTPFLILHLGKDLYGVWILLLSFSVSGTLSLLSLGMQAALVKHVAEYRALGKRRELNQLISSTLYVYASMGVVGAFGLLWFSLGWFTRWFAIPAGQAQTAILMLDLMAVQVAVELPGMCFDGVLGGLQRYDILAALELGKSALLAVLFAVVLLHGATIVALSRVTLAVTFFHALALLAFASAELGRWRLVWRFERTQLLSVVDMTKDLLILRLNGIIYNNMDKMIIAAVLSTAMVTNYDIGNRIHSMALMVMGLAGTVVIPAASAAHARSESEAIRAMFLKGTKYALAMTLPVVSTLFVLAPSLIRYWISPQYVGSAFYARLFLSYMLFWSVTSVGWNMLIGVRQTKPIVRIQLVSVAINLGLSLVLVRHVGVSGVVYGTMMGNLVAFFPYMRLMMRSFKVTAKEIFFAAILTTYPQALASTASLLLLMRVWEPGSMGEVIVQAVFAVAVYVALFAMTGMSRAERRQAWDLLPLGMGKQRYAGAQQRP